MPTPLKDEVIDAMASMVIELDEASSMIKDSGASHASAGGSIDGGLPQPAVAAMIVWHVVRALWRLAIRCGRGVVGRVTAPRETSAVSEVAGDVPSPSSGRRSPAGDEAVSPASGFARLR